MSMTMAAGASNVMVRNWLVARSLWVVMLSGFLEPVLYLFSIGVGVGQLVPGFEVDGRFVEYAAFVAPAMLAASAFNGALYDSTFNVFFKLRFQKTYDAMLATPMRVGDVARGEIAWCLVRSGFYSAVFLLIMVAMGLAQSWWTLLAWPATWLIGLATAVIGMSATTYMKSWQDFELITLLVTPMLLFSATFFPVDGYPAAVRWVVELTPLYRGVVLCRELTTGAVTDASLWSVLYFAVITVIGIRVVSRRLERLLLT